MRREELRTIYWNALRAVAPESDPAALSPQAPVREALDLDSMDMLRFVTALGVQLGLDIPERDYAELETTERALAYLERRKHLEP